MKHWKKWLPILLVILLCVGFAHHLAKPFLPPMAEVVLAALCGTIFVVEFALLKRVTPLVIAPLAYLLYVLYSHSVKDTEVALSQVFQWCLLLALFFRLLFQRYTEAATQRRNDFVKDLRSQLPEKVDVFIDIDMHSTTERSSLQEGHLISVHPGDIVPADGIVTFGSSFVNEAILVGSDQARAVSMGSYVFAGTENKNGAFIFRAENVGGQTVLEETAAFLESSFGSAQSLLEKHFLTLEMFIIAAAVFFVFQRLFLLSEAILLGFLPIAALDLLAAVQSNFVLQSTGLGFSWRSENAINAAGAVDTIVCEREGFLTKGKLKLGDFRTEEGVSEEAALRFLGPMARRIENSQAFAILQEMKVRSIPMEILEFFSYSADGAAGLIAGDDVRWVDGRFIGAGEEFLPWMDFQRAADLLARPVIYLILDDRVIAALSFIDSSLDHVAEDAKNLQREHFSLFLCSRFPSKSLESFSSELATPHFVGDLSPSLLANLERELRQKKLAPFFLLSTLNASQLELSAALGDSKGRGHLLLCQRNLPSVLSAFLLARRYRTLRNLYSFFVGFLFVLFFFAYWQNGIIGWGIAACVGLALEYIYARAQNVIR